MANKITAYTKQIAQNPNDAMAYYNRGIELRDAGDAEKALQDFSKVIELEPNNDKAFHQRAFISYNLNKVIEAFADMDAAIKINPNDLDLYCNRGIMYQNNGNEEEAIADFDQVLILNPKDTETYTLRGKAKYMLGKKFAALHFDVTNDEGKMVEIGKSSRETSFTLFEAAIADFDKALSFNPDDDDADYYTTEAQEELKEGRLIQKIYTCNAIIETNSNDAGAYYERGMAKLKLGEEEDDIIADFDRSIALNPNAAEVYWSRGLIKDQIGQFTEAIDDYTLAIEKNPNFDDAFYSRGLAKFNRTAAPAQENQKLDNYPEALADLDKAIAINPNHFNAYNAKGLIYNYMGKTKTNYEQAISHYEKAIELGLQEQPEMYYHNAIEKLNQLK